MCPYVNLVLLVVQADTMGLLTCPECSFYEYARLVKQHGNVALLYRLIVRGNLPAVAAKSLCAQLQNLITQIEVEEEE